MSNPYYVFAPEFIPGTKARSDDVNLQYSAIQNAFDLLPNDPDAITSGTVTFAPESGTGNLYVVTMPNTRTTEQDGDEVVFFATHTNTAAPTIEVDGLGAKAIVRADGSALQAGDLVNGLLYIVRYDASNTRYQLVTVSTSYLTDTEAARDAAIASAAAALVSEGLANEWAVNPVDDDISTAPGEFSALHWSSGSQEWATRAIDSLIPANFGGGAGDYSARHWSAGAQDWATRAEDDPVGTTFGGNGVDTYSAFHWAQKALGAATIQTIVADINTATPPTTEAVTAVLRYEDADQTDTLAQIGFNGSNVLRIRNFMHGGTFSLEAEDASGVNRSLILAGPANPTLLYDAGDLRFATQNDSIRTFADITTLTPPTTEAVQASLEFYDSDNSDFLGAVGFQGSNILRLRNYMHGGSILIQGETSGGALETKASFENGLNRFYVNGSEMFRTLANTVRVFTDITTLTPPTTEAVTGGYDIVDNDTSDFLMRSGFFASNQYVIDNVMNGGGIALRGDDSGNVNVPLATFDPDGQSLIYYDGSLRLETRSGGIGVRGAGNTDAETRIVDFLYQNGTRRGYVGHAGGTAMYLFNAVHGGPVILEAEDAGGVTRQLVNADPDNSVDLYYAGKRTMQVGNDVIDVFASINTASPPTTEAVVALNRFRDSDNTDTLGFMGFNGSNELVIQNRMHGAPIALRAENNAGVSNLLFFGDPDSVSGMYHAGTQVARTLTAANGGFEVNNTLTGAGFERVATESDLAGAGTLDWTVDQSDTFIIDRRNLVVDRNYAGVNAVEPLYADVTYGRFSAGIDQDLILDSGVFGLASGNTNGAGVGTFNPVRVYRNASDVRVMVEWPRLNNERLAFRGYHTSAWQDWQYAITGSAENNINMAASATIRASLNTTGRFNVHSDGNLDTEQRSVNFTYQDGTVRGSVGHVSSDVLQLRNLIHGGNVSITAEDGAGATTTLFEADPDGIAAIYHDAGRVMFTHPDGITIEDPNGTSPYIAFGATTGVNRQGFIQTTASRLEIRSETHGADIRIGGEDGAGVFREGIVIDPDDQIDMYAAGVLRFTVAAGLVSVRGTLGNDPTTGGVQNAEYNMANSAGTEVGDINYLSSQNMNIRNLVHGGSIILTAQDSAGTNRTILNGDPDAQTTLRADTQLNLQTNAGESAIVCQQNAAVNIYYDGTLTAATGVEAFNIYANDSVSTSTVQLQLREASGSLRAQMGYSGSSTFFIRSVIHGAAIAINAEDSGGVLRNILNADPDNTTTLTGDTTLELSTNASVRLSINSVGDFNYNDNLLDRAEMGDYSVQVEDLGVVANANVTLTYSNGNAFEFDIENWSTNRTVTLSGGPPSGTYGVMEVKITQDNTAARTITWAGGVFVWLNGTAHPLNPTLGGISIYVFETWDGGGTWYASGADYG